MSRGKKRYTEDFKRSAAKLAIESEHRVNKMCRLLSVSRSAYYAWLHAKYNGNSWITPYNPTEEMDSSLVYSVVSFDGGVYFGVCFKYLPLIQHML